MSRKFIPVMLSTAFEIRLLKRGWSQVKGGTWLASNYFRIIMSWSHSKLMPVAIFESTPMSESSKELRKLQWDINIQQYLYRKSDTISVQTCFLVQKFICVIIDWQTSRLWASKCMWWWTSFHETLMHSYELFYRRLYISPYSSTTNDE